jgi:hypothetical protein
MGRAANHALVPHGLLCGISLRWAQPALPHSAMLRPAALRRGLGKAVGTEGPTCCCRCAMHCRTGDRILQLKVCIATPVGNAALVVANVLMCNKLSHS